MNQALAAAQDTQNAWLDAVAFGLVLCDAELNVLRANARCAEMLGADADAMRARPLCDLLEIPERQRVLVTRAIAQQRPWQGLSRSGDRALKVEIRSAGDGVVASLIDYSSDLEQLQRLTDAKTLAEKSSEAKSQFLQHMSHELRTPLNAIIGFTQLLRISQGLDARALDNVTEIERAGESLLALINEILELSKIEAGKLKLNEAQVDLRELAADCLQLLAPAAQSRAIHIDVQVDDDCLLMADYVRTKQVLMNLLSNAIKFNKDGGRVSLRASLPSPDHVRIEIHDSGIGIAPEHLDTIFAPFNRPGVIEGSGLGLMITRRLVTLMQGDVGVTSTPGTGSLFWVELPRRRECALDRMLRQRSALERAQAGAVSGRYEAQSEADRTERSPAIPGGLKKP